MESNRNKSSELDQAGVDAAARIIYGLNHGPAPLHKASKPHQPAVGPCQECYRIARAAVAAYLSARTPPPIPPDRGDYGRRLPPEIICTCGADAYGGPHTGRCETAKHGGSYAGAVVVEEGSVSQPGFGDTWGY